MMESLFLICLATAITAFVWTILALISDYIIDPILRRRRNDYD